MHPTSRALAVILICAACASGAAAQIPDRALRAFDEGQFLTAAKIAEATGDADGLAFAARALIADAVTRDHVFCLQCLLQAEATAKQAIKRDPHFAEGYIQFAIAMGFRGRLMSVSDALSEGLPEKGRDAILKALELDPSNNWARAALGGWHLEVVHRAGRVVASVVYAASEEEGVKNFRKALAVEPDSLLLHFHFALSTLAVDVEKYRAEAGRVLDEGQKDPHTDALTRQMRALADELQAALRTQNDIEVAQLVHKLQGYPDDLDPQLAKPN